MHRRGLHYGYLFPPTGWPADCLPACSLNHSMGMEHILANFSVLEELSNDTEDGNFVPEMVCRERTATAV